MVELIYFWVDSNLNMEQEYTTSTGYKIFYGVLAIALVGFTIFLSLKGNNSGDDYHHNTGLLILPVIGITAAALIIINLIKRKITVSDYSVSRTNIWGTKEILYKDIKGFRIGDKAIFIYPLDGSGSKLSINDYISIGDDKGLKAWLGEHFQDLNKVEYEASKQEILHDQTFGITTEEREQKLKYARKYSTVYSMIAIGVFFGAIIFHLQNVAFIALLFIYPLAGILLIAYSKGLIKLFAKKNSAYSAIFIGILFPAAALTISALSNGTMLSYDKLWVPAAIVALAVLLVLYFVTINNVTENILGQIFFAVLIAAVYGFGSILQVNCGFDDSVPQVYQATITDHYIGHGKSTSYHLTLSDWNGNPPETISVSHSFYDEEPIGAKVNVDLKKGRLSAPWFYVTE